MHIEVQVALNFVISYLYNKLPRRRVNIFGEELERALKDKFRGHWYPEKPFRGSAFRCLKTGDPVDPVLERAARESGVPVQDILENLPHELAVWVDPGEVSGVEWRGEAWRGHWKKQKCSVPKFPSMRVETILLKSIVAIRPAVMLECILRFSKA